MQEKTQWLSIFLIFLLILKKEEILRLVIKLREELILFPHKLKKILGFIKKAIKDPEVRLFSYIFIINLIIKLFIDYIITPPLMGKVGYWYCLLITSFIYIFIGFISLQLYDFYKIDCLKIELLKKTQYTKDQKDYRNNFAKFILDRNIENKIFFSVLLAAKNPGLVVIYLREGYDKYNGFTTTYIKTLFVVSPIIISIGWNTLILLWSLTKEYLIELFSEFSHLIGEFILYIF